MTQTRPALRTTASTIPLVNECARLARKVDEFLGSAIGEGEDVRSRTIARTKKSLDVISEGLRRYTFDELAISFNGGKDCLVMLVLLLASIHYHKAEYAPQRIHSVYVQSANAFEEVDEFVMECGEQYSLDLIRVPGPMKAAFEKFLSARPQIKAIMVGTRRTDPNGAGLGDFDETDGGWPRFMRIQPVIEWQYEEVWFFLREVGIKYCVLYDLGYTSLGGTTDTFKNPALRVGEEYLPAHELEDGTKERMGRA